MAEFTERVKLLIETVTDKATSDLHNLKTKVEETDGGFGKLKTGAAGLGPALAPAIAVGIAGLVGLGAAAIETADKFEKAHAQLENITKNVGGNFEELSKSVDTTDKAMEHLGFTNDETEASLARLTVATKDVHKSEELMGLAADIARARNIDLGAATDILVKVEQGRYQQLVRIGVISKEQQANIHSEADAIKLLSGIYGGAAAANAETFAGKMEVLHATITDLTTKIGLALIPVVEGAAQKFEQIVGALQSANTATDGWLGKVGLIGVGTVAAVVAISAMVSAVSSLVGVVTAAAAAVGTFGTAMAAFAVLNPEVAGLLAIGAAMAYVATQSSDATDRVTDVQNAFNQFGLQGVADQIAASWTSPLLHAGNASDVAALKVKAAADAHKQFLELLKSSPAVAVMYRDAAQQAGLDTSAWADDITKAALAAAQGKQANKEWAGAVDDAGTALDGTTGSTEDNTKALKEQQKAIDAEVKSLQAQEQALKNDEKALNAVTDAMLASADAQYAADKAGRDAQQTLDDQPGKLKKISDDLKKGSIDAATAEREKQQVYDDTAQILEKNATAQEEAAKATVEATGATFTHAQALDERNASLLTAVANTNGPVRASLINYIATINGIPPSKATEILADTNKDNLAEKKADLDAVSVGRTVAVTADADQQAINDTQAKLDALKAPTLTVTMPTVADIMASADPATASFFSGDSPATTIPATVTPSVDPTAKDTTNTDLNNTANPPGGRTADIAVKADLGTAKADIDNVASNNGQGYHAVVHVTSQTDKAPGGMAGVPRVPDGGGFYDVGEAGRERVFLPGGSSLMTAGNLMTAEAMGGGGAVHIINLSVSVAPTANLAQAGREISNALEAFYRSSGSRRAYASA